MNKSKSMHDKHQIQVVHTLLEKRKTKKLVKNCTEKILEIEYNPFSQQKFLSIQMALANLTNAIFDLRCSWQPAFARIDHTHSMESQHSRSIPKFTPKCKRLMLHTHSSLYLAPHNYTPCIKTPFFVKKNFF